MTKNEPMADGYVVTYKYIRMYEFALKKVRNNIYLGLGYQFDYHWGITELNVPPGRVTDFKKYGYSNTSTSSGFALDILYDSRKSSINPEGGSFFAPHILTFRVLDLTRTIIQEGDMTKTTVINMNSFQSFKTRSLYVSILLLLLLSPSCTAFCQDLIDLKLKDYRPVSIYKIPQTRVERAKYPVVDFHTHDYPKTEADVDEWVRTMDAAGIAKSIILSYSTGAGFDSIVDKYARYKDRFEIWCGFDYTGYDQPGWEGRAVSELERCYKKGAGGVGELGDKGLGEFYSLPTPGYSIHIDDPRMKPLLEKCAKLHMPVSIHVAEDAWMYHQADSTNDGLMNAAKWHVDLNKQGILNHDQLMTTLENAVKNNPKTTFIACHLANCCADLNMLGRLFDTYPNLYADIAARYAEIAPVPRFVHAFIEKYSNRIVYGTDMGTAKDMYETTFRILESADEHFYEYDRFGYHWPLHGLSLSAATLKKIYSVNSKKILSH